MPKNSFKSNNKTNFLREALLQENAIKCSKSTIEMLFRSLIEPMVNCKDKSLILVRLIDTAKFENILKRINFVNPNIFSMSKNLDFLKNVEENNSLGSTEFLSIFTPRYSAILIWDYSLSDELDYEDNTSSVYLMLNSRKAYEITKSIADISSFELAELLQEFSPERRANETMNEAIENIATYLNSSIQEFELIQAEKNTAVSEIDLYSQYETTYNKISPVSHEIRNNLSVIDLYSKILEKKLEMLKCNDEEILSACKNAVASINKALFSAAFMLNSLKNSEIHFSENDLNNIILNVIQLATPRLVNENVELIYEEQQNIFIKADEIKFQNVLLNLIYNAIDAINESGRIEIKINRSEDYAIINIKDNGIGICQSVKDNLFAQGQTTKKNGLGLGLSICKSNLREQNGDIRLVDTNENGTEFEIKIPLSVR